MIELLFLLTVLVNFLFATKIPIINLPDGQVGGQQYITENNKVYYGFRGIPYAKPPVGNLRFEPPQPSQPWSGILDGTEDSKCCISFRFLYNQDEESEDCLYISVYTPSLNPWPWTLPVMFWIYGGDFIEGNASKMVYGPDFFMEEDVILVTFNYRLGPFGFLSTGDTVLPGNNGLKDQNLALQWTNKNIQFFGGDPSKITIFGQSAGGVSVASHILSKKSVGLFRAAIIESSSALVPWALDLNPEPYAFKLADKVGYNGQNSLLLKMFLKTRSVMEIFNATNYLKYDWPVLETPNNKEAYLTESNYELLQRGDFNRVPTIIGFCSEESLSFLINIFLAEVEALAFDSNPVMLIPPDLNPNVTDTSPIIQNIRDLYINKNESFHSNITGYAKFITDDMFARGIIKHAELQSIFSPVYLYQFAYYGRPFIEAFIDGAEKVGHTAEIPFLFKMAEINDNDPDNLLMQRRLVKLWSNFAKYTNPTPAKTELLDNIQWPTISPGNLQFLNINVTLEVRPSLKGREYSAWNDIFNQYGRKPFILY